MNTSPKEITSKIKSITKTSRGKDILLFLIFLGVAFIFWLLLTFNNETQEDITIPLEIIEIPDSVTVIDNFPQELNVSVRDKGSSLLRYMWAETPALKVRFSEHNEISDQFRLNKTDIDTYLRAYFGKNSQIISSNPDSIRFNYTTSPAIRVKLNINADISPHLQYVINGDIKASVDSVDLFYTRNAQKLIGEAETELIVRDNLKDTTVIHAIIKPIKGVKIVPNAVDIVIPVEPLIVKQQKIALKPLSVPENINLILFPSSIDISYLLPMSKYNQQINDISVSADYNYILENKTSTKIPLVVTFNSKEIKNVEIYPDSVEYIIEQK